MLKKSESPTPSSRPLAEEMTTVQGLGKVLVRELQLGDRLQVAITPGYARMAAMLALSVLVLDDKKNPPTYTPLWSAEEWEIWGGRNYAEALRLWDMAQRLSDLEGDEAQKKSTPQQSELPADLH